MKNKKRIEAENKIKTDAQQESRGSATRSGDRRRLNHTRDEPM